MTTRETWLPKFCYSCGSVTSVPIRVTASAAQFEVLMQCKGCLKEWVEKTTSPPEIRTEDTTT